jgi:hypothetical protein
MTDEIKQAEKRGYSRGYNAGARRKKDDRYREQQRKENQAFLDRAFIAVLSTALVAEGWTFGDEPINSTEDRVKLANRWAYEALRQRPYS